MFRILGRNRKKAALPQILGENLKAEKINHCSEDLKEKV